MKRIWRILAAWTAALAIGLFSIPTSVPVSATTAEDGDEKAPLYVKVPEDWENPCVWAWNEDGTNAFDVWPGEELDADSANEGWYYIYLPAWANQVIVNANAGEVQTDGLELDNVKAWVAVSAADSVDVSYEAQTEGEAPEYVEKFAIHAKVDESWAGPCLWAWSAPDGKNAFEEWPGKAMTLEESGWYTAKAPVWVNSVIVNANEGGVQTEDISIDPSEVWITVAEDGSFEYSYVDPDKESVPDVTVRVKAPSDWENPCIWAWSAPDGTNVYATWPGEELEEDENGWLKKVIPGWVNSIIINGSEGGIQTTDIDVESGKDIWLVVDGQERYEVYYEEPEGTGDSDGTGDSAGTGDSDGTGDSAGTGDDDGTGDSAGAGSDSAANTSQDGAADDGGNGSLIPAVAGGGIAAVAVIGGVVAWRRKKSA